MAESTCPDMGDSSKIVFTVGESFSTLRDFETKIKLFEGTHFMKFWKREARTVASAKKRIDRQLNEDLLYYQLKYCSINGGQVFKSKSSGIRNTS